MSSVSEYLCVCWRRGYFSDSLINRWHHGVMLPPTVPAFCAKALYVNDIIMLFRSIDWMLQSEVRSHGGDGLHLHNTVALGVPLDWKTNSSCGAVLMLVVPHCASKLWPFPLSTRQSYWQEFPTHRPSPHITLLLSDAQISRRLILQMLSPQHAVYKPGASDYESSYHNFSF